MGRIALEGFQESYHFCSRKHTACSAYLDNQSVFLDQYPHVRHGALGGRGVLQDKPEAEWDYRANYMFRIISSPAISCSP